MLYLVMDVIVPYVKRRGVMMMESVVERWEGEEEGNDRRAKVK